jgi:outer membrane protein TolC
MKNLFSTIFFCLWIFSAPAQRIETLDYQSYLEWVSNYHPVASQAEITLRMGEMEIKQARGAFDPMVFGNLDKKSFQNKTYYDKNEAGISVPTWAGVELNGVFEQNSGQFLNSENTLPSAGLFAMGASLNLGQGFILDERRAALRQAQIYNQSTESQRIQMLNELYLQATDAYWKWALSYANLLVLQEGLSLAQTRFEAVKGSFRQGDLAAIDTVEAYAQVLNREYRFQNAQNNYFGARQLLNTFLWDSEATPMALQEEILPEILQNLNAGQLDAFELRELVGRHPDLQLADFELASLEIERKLKAQQILPVVKLKYNFLTETLNQNSFSPFLENNYKFGVSVYTPLLLRKSRGALGLAKAKIDFKQSTRELKFVQLENKLEAELNTFFNLTQQLTTFEKNVKSLDALLQGEVRRFEIGESSLFLVNARETTAFDARLILNELISQSKIAFAKARFAAGLGFD